MRTSAKEYASAAGTLLYHALDRPDLQFTVGRLMSAITKPQRKTPGDDETLLEVFGRSTVLRLEVRLARVARGDRDLV